ncbi:MAG: RnfABCDGE type electron transport complex subunit B [Elusimicrobiota bacterium]
MNYITVLHSVLVFGIIGLAAGLILVISYSKLKVKEDPKIRKIGEILPGINCGACGYASCHEYAVAVASKDETVDKCVAGGDEVANEIAGILGVESGSGSQIKAVVKCGVQNRKYNARYGGPENCGAADLVGGGLSCKYGCFGYGDCVDACPFDAIHLNDNNLPEVNFDKCTGCGLCVEACPRNIIELVQPEDGRIVYVGCSNEQSGKNTRQVCDSGCIGCKICEKKAPEGMFVVKDNLAGVDHQDREAVVDEIKCPTGCIYELTEDNG